MALLRKLFYKKPPDGLLQISERVYVFGCCFTTDAWGPEDYKGYVGNTIAQLKDHYPEASILVFNFGEVESSKIASVLSEYDMTIMDYPRQYEGCPLLPMEVIHHFLRSSESWLLLGQQNILLMHCEQGGWPVLACMLAALLIYRKQYSGEYKTLDMVYKQAPRQLLHLFTPLNPLPSQLRYLQYISREWPPLDRALTLDCVIIRMIPDFDGNGGCCPTFRVYGQDSLFPGDKTPRLVFSTPKGSRNVRYYKKAESELVKIDINCHVQGDVVLECISLHDDLTREKMMYRAVFNTAFIRSNNLMLSRDEIDILWDAKELFPMDFRAELLFSDMDAAASPTLPLDLSYFEEEGLPIEAFAKVQEMFSSVDCLSPNNDANQIAASDVVHEKLETGYRQSVEANNLLQQKEKSPTSSDNKPKMEKPSSPDAGGQKLPSPVPLKSPSSPPLAPSVPADAMDQKSSSYPLSQPSPPTLPLKNLVCSKGQSPVFQSHLPSIEQSQEVADNEVKPTLTPFPPSMLPPSPSLKDTKVEFSQLPPTQTAPETPPSGNLTKSPFPPSILHSSKLKRDKIDSKVEPSQSLSSLTHPATPLKDKRDNVLEPSPPPPPPPPPPPLKDKPVTRAGLSPAPPLPPPPPVKEGGHERVASRSPVPPPPLPPAPRISSGPPPPPPPPTFSNGNVKTGVAPPPPPSLPRSGNNPGAPSLPPPLMKGCGGLSRAGSLKNQQSKKLKPLHWFKLTRALQGSLWAETQQPGEAAKAPEIDISELESLFSAANLKPKPEQGADKSKSRAAVANKPKKIQLINHKRAYNCEIMFSKVKIPLNELMDYVLALEESAMDADQVESLIKFCPTKEEMELLKNYKGETDKLGKCEQIFLELMKVPRTESKLRVFSFKLQFSAQVSDLRKSLNTINSAVEQTRGSAKLKRVMQTILSLGNALNQGTARGSAIGFRLDSLLKLTETRARNNRMTLMHYLCKVLGDKLPEVVDFSKDLGSLEPAAKMQLKYLAEEMQAISNGLKKAVEELSMAEYDGPVSDNFRKALEGFLCSADGEVRSLKSLDSMVRKNVDALILYFGEDPARCSYEQVVSTLLKFVRMFNQANEENAKQIKVEKKKAEKEASNEKMKQEHLPHPVKSGN